MNKKTDIWSLAAMFVDFLKPMKDATYLKGYANVNMTKIIDHIKTIFDTDSEIDKAF